MTTFTNIIIFCLIVGFIGTTIGGVANQISEEQGLTDFDQSTLSAYNSTSETANIITEVSEQSNTSVNPGALDLLGDYFGKGYAMVKISGKSLETTSDIASQGVSQAKLGTVGGSLTVLILSILAVLVFIYIIGKVLTKVNV